MSASRYALLLVLLGAIAADEWRFALDVASATEQRISLDGIDLSGVDRLQVAWQGRGIPLNSQMWLEIALVTGDGRWFINATTLAVRPEDRSTNTVELLLEPTWWGGRDGSLSGDAVRATQELCVRLHGGHAGTVEGTVTPVARHQAPRFAVEAEAPGLIERCGDDGQAVWREWRLRLVGDLRGSTGTLDLRRGDGSRLPFFLEQPATVNDGRWRSQGTPRWVVRLRLAESIPGPVHLVWQGHGRDWTSPPLVLPTLTSARESLPAVPRAALPIPQAPAWRGHPARLAEGGFERCEVHDLPACPAPALIWRSDWTGFRGPQAVGHLQALAVDRILSGARELDLLPDWLTRDQGSFRFSLAPWHASMRGPWQYVQELFEHDDPWRDWRAAARELIARARAAPQLERWRLGLTAAATGEAQVARLVSLERELAALVAASDGRPLISLHPQVVPFARHDREGVWADFESGDQGWRSQAGLPFAAGQAAQFNQSASQGQRALIIPLAGVGGVRLGGVTREVDANVMNLDRLEFDAHCSGPLGATVQFYAWCTDRHHRWYQQRLPYLPCAPRWTTMMVEFASDAAWQPVGHQAAWDGNQRQQLRRLGLVAFVHGDLASAAQVSIDRVRRLGWPNQAQPTLAITELEVAAAPTTRYAAIAADFALSLPVANPYDSAQADVVGEVEGPAGQGYTYPAYWAEPFTLAFAEGVERALPTGCGAWHWRFSPPAAGLWRWRLRARVRWREQILSAETSWQTCRVPERLPLLQPVRQGLKDPRWFERSDDSWWYPIGPNLRSPSDTRQDRVLRQQAGTQAPDRRGEPLTYQTLGWTSAEFESLGTRAYERWFSRMEQARMNWARVWMCPWWCGLEWSRQWDEFGGLKVYNQAAAARLDRVMELAAQHGVYVQLELQNHGMTSSTVDQQWDPDGRGNPGSPYSRRNGGPCASPAEFYRREEAWIIHEQRLRYTLARWGHLSHLAAFVLTSEMEFTGDWQERAFANQDGGHAEATAAWVRRSLRWFAERDPQQRPVSMHFSHPWRGHRLWREPGLGFSNSNAYTGFQERGIQRLGGPGAGLDGALQFYLDQHFPPWELKRPTLIGEWGGHWDRNTPEILGQELHTGLWLQAALPYGGNTGFWWWLWMDVADTWNEYRAVVDFATANDPRGRNLRSARAKASNPQVEAVGAASAELHRYYVWIAGLDRTPRSALAEAGTLRIVTGQPGSRWMVERWNCHTGMASDRREYTAEADGTLTLTLGELDPDAAFTLRRSAPTAAGSR